MKASFYKIEPPQEESFRCLRVRECNFGTPWHFHPEYQITLVVRSHGHRVIGDNTAAFGPGDLTLIGPNLPHFWHHGDAGRPAEAGGAEALMVHFHEEFMGGPFLQRPELSAVAGLLRQSARGLQFPEAVRRQASENVARLFDRSGLPRLIELMALLDLMAGARATPICSPAFSPQLNRSDQRRMERVCQHVHAHLDADVSRDDLARLAGLSPRSFSRYFRQKTGKTLPGFVNELRIGRASRLLLESELPVVAVALECGFPTLSNFNEQFRRLKRVCPSEFRRTERARIAQAGDWADRAP